MKLGICCNFTHPSVGGSEIVCKAIAESMANTYGMDVTTFGCNVQKDFVHNEVKYTKCLKGNTFLNQIQNLDHLFIYSDSFWGFEAILDNLDFIRPTLSIALLGMYAMHEDDRLFSIFQDNIKHFKVITHSNGYQDYKKCFDNKIPVTVIPNGVDLKEFNTPDKINIREKYEIDTEKVILNVSNYFYGKGQEYLAPVCSFLQDMREGDFTLVQLSNTVKYPHDKTFLQRAKKQFINTNIKHKFLRDIPREDVIMFFKQSDVTVLTSLKEVSPIVLLESMASETPWVSMNVGNAQDLGGGISIPYNNHDQKGYKIITPVIARSLASMINVYLEREDCSDGRNGRDLVELIYNWDKICEQYYNIFKG